MTTNRQVFVLLCAALWHNALVLCQENNRDSPCYDNEGMAIRCEPPRQSFSFQQQPQVNSTCGTPPSTFCVREVNVLDSIVSSCTEVCNASSIENAHPAQLLTDFILNEASWWQSENSASLEQTVVIDIALDAKVELRVITFNFVSLFPSMFQIHKSDDFGQTFVPFHQFSTTCFDTFGLSPDEPAGENEENSILCQSIPQPSYLSPRQISFFPVLGRPSANDSIPGYSEVLYDFITATNIRVILMEHYQIDNLSPSDFGYYYAIEDLNIVGSCQCNGHASSCSISPTTNEYQCVCEHNTTGTYCDRCADFFQDVPWRRADGSDHFECRPCNCNNHSTVCVFDQEVFENSGNTSGGVCVNCSDNTAGPQCERCAELYYPPSGVYPRICVECDCNIAGVVDNGSCAQESGPTVQEGDCNCKQNVEGRTCSQCILGFFNLNATNPLGCQECQCNMSGSIDSICDQTSGVCTCKPNVVGDNCDRCRHGYYMPDPTDVQGCLPCNCNAGGSLSGQCDFSTGQCLCREGIGGLTCSETLPGFFFPTIDFLLLEAENAFTTNTSFVLGDATTDLFTGTGFSRVLSGSSSISFGALTPPVSGLYEVLFRYRGTVMLDAATLTIEDNGSIGDTSPALCQNDLELEAVMQLNYTSWMTGAGLTISQTVCMRGGSSYSFTLSNFDFDRTPSFAAMLDIDSLVLILLESTDIQVFTDPVIADEYSSCVDDWKSLVSQPSASLSCKQTTFAVFTDVYNGTLECDCNATGTHAGSTCEECGGQCRCLPGVGGRQCDECTVGFFNLSTSGCKECDCNANMSVSPICNSIDGSCECLMNVDGIGCSSCAIDHWGFTMDGGCQPCTCNQTGSTSTQCDQSTGECDCKEGVQGENCDRCQDYHYGFSQNGCRHCGCDLNGSTGVSCDVTSGQCSCKQNVLGRDCSECVPGTFNIQISNPSGCQPCFCSGRSQSCSPAEGYVGFTIVTDFAATNSDPLQGWTVVQPDSGTHTNVSMSSAGEGLIITASSGVYLQSPSEYLGNKLSSYNQFIEVSLTPFVDNIDIANIRSMLPYDIIISGNDVELGANFTSNITGLDSFTLQIQLQEASGWINTATNTSASALDILNVLSFLDYIRISSSFNEDVVLLRVEMDSTMRSSGDNGTMFVMSVEQCDCPANYSGLSCDQCASGYMQTSDGTCELCNCNGFSTLCDPETGECTNCTQSTTGTMCERCAVGTFGDPSSGIPCLPCPCPLAAGDGQFTSECILTMDGNVMCLNCPEGHTGLQCETCIGGYFGDPTGNITSTPTICSNCQCNDNIDPSVQDSCNPVTGVCEQCINNTSGNQCERCADGYFGDAITAKNCTECECNPQGSTGVCDHLTGQCECLGNVTGRKCDQCLLGHYGLNDGSGCLACICHPEGSENSQCSDSGRCTCLPGVTGLRCDQCLPGYFQLSANGCEECLCSIVNAEGVSCDDNGQCACRLGAAGNKCGQCVFNYYNTNMGCVACPDCYQELQLQLSTTNQSLISAAQNIQALNDQILNGFTPFISRLLRESNNVSTILNLALQLASGQEQTMAEYNDLFLFSQSLVNRGSQLNISISELERLSITVLVIASATDELVERIIRNYVEVGSLLQQIELSYLPSIQNTTSFVLETLNTSISNVIFLHSTFSELSQQIVEINDVVRYVFNLDAQQSMTLFENTSEVLVSIDRLTSTINAAISSISLRLSNIIVNSMIAMEYVQRLVPFSELVSVDTVVLEVNATSSYAKNISNEISHNQMQFLSCNETLYSYLEDFNSLQQRVSGLQIVANELLDRSLAANNSASTEQTSLLTDAMFAVRILQSFAANSSQVLMDANQALASVRNIDASASSLTEFAETTVERIEQLSSDVASVRNDNFNVGRSVRVLKEDLSSVDTTTFTSLLLVSANSSSSSLQKSSNLSDLVKNISDRIEAEVPMIDQTNTSIDEARTETNQIRSYQSPINDLIKQLEKNVSELIALDVQTLLQLEQMIVTVGEQVNASGITNLYNLLTGTLQEQRERRKELEDSLQTFSSTVAYLTHINNTLLSC